MPIDARLWRGLGRDVCEEIPWSAEAAPTAEDADRQVIVALLAPLTALPVADREEAIDAAAARGFLAAPCAST